MPQLDLFHELSYYTLAHKSERFIHQHIVDAYTAQTADEKTKRIAIVFALAGLYLHLVKGYSGKQVQQAHMKMAMGSKIFEKISLPINRGDVSIVDVFNEQPGPNRDAMIEVWCSSVWESYHNVHDQIANLVGLCL